MKLQILHNNYAKTLEKYTIQGYTVPKGIVIDGGSIPRAFRFISHPRKQPYLPYFVNHDVRYIKKDISRKEADDLFFEGIRQHSFIKAWLFWIAVRLFGWIPRHFKN